MNCLVLGGGGFIGSHLCDALLERGHRVRIFEKEGRSHENVCHQNKAEWMEGDFSNPEHLKAAVAGMDIVYHLISTTLPKSSNESMVYDISSNIIPTVQLLDFSVHAGIRKIVFLSSGGTVYGIPRSIPIPEDHPTNPICSYGIQKLTIEKYLKLFYQLHGLDFTVLRVANPYGERQRTTGSQGAITVFLSKALKDETIEIWGDGSVVRDYLHISDVISAAVRLVDCSPEEKIFNIGSGIGLPLTDVISAIEQAIGRKVRVNYTPVRSFDVKSNVLDISLALRHLNWRPEIDLQSGLVRFTEYLRKHG